MRRRTFLTAAGALAVAGCGGGSDDETTTGGGATARAPGSPDDAGVIAYMLELEQLQRDLYRQGADAPFLAAGEREVIQALAAQEDEHVTKLTSELKRLRRPAPKPLALKVPVRDRAALLGTAYRLENLTAAAYLGQVERLVDRGVLATLTSIQTVEGRHAAAVGALLGKTATPDGAFARGFNMATITRVREELAT